MSYTAGVMAARGILKNPAMFAGHGVNKQVLSNWVSVSLSVYAI